jgi:hypothetical protein
MKKDLSFARLMNPPKIAGSGMFENPDKEKYVPKHPKKTRPGRLIWDTAKQGTYVHSKHGEIGRRKAK